jgi:hypothetical protein
MFFILIGLSLVAASLGILAGNVSKGLELYFRSYFFFRADGIRCRVLGVVIHSKEDSKAQEALV